MMTLLQRYPVALQIGAGFSVGVALLAIVAAIGLHRIAIVRARADEAAVLSSIRALTRDVMVQMLDESAAVRGYAATGDRSYLAAQDAADQRLRADLAALDKSDQTDAVDSGRLEQIDISAATIEADVSRLQTMFRQSGRGSFGAARGPVVAAELAQQEAAFSKLRRHDDALLSYVSDQAADATAQFRRATVEVVVVLLASTASAVGALILTAFLVGGGIARRLWAVTQALRDVTERDVAALAAAFDGLGRGDLSAAFHVVSEPVTVDGGDEIAKLAQSYNGVVAGLGLIASEFNRMTQDLREVAGGIVQAANDLAGASARMSIATSESTAAVEQISVAMAGVAGDSRQQAERIASASEQIDELSAGAHRIADGSSRQSRSSLEAVAAVRSLDEQIAAFASLGTALAAAAAGAQAQAHSGEASVAHTAQAMSDIVDATGIAESAMKTLETSSSAVSEIVSAIDDLADQTNLLALNAAIEAARAGDQGRGFAVVADEVRKLAERSRSSTKEITAILDGIRAESLRAAGAIATASSQMKSGMTRSEQATQALVEVGSAIAQTAEIAAEVAHRSAAMHAASSALTRSIANASAITDDNAAAASGVRERSEAVLATIRPVAESAQSQAQAASEVSDATVALSNRIAEIDASSRTARAQSELLRKLVAVFGGAKEAPARIVRIAAVLALAALAFHASPARATTEIARRTMLSCTVCHGTGIRLNAFGKAYKARGFRLAGPLVPSGDVPVTLQAQAGYFSDPDPTGLPKVIVDKVILLAGAPLGDHFGFGGQQYVMDGGVPGDLRELWGEYHSTWTNAVPIDVRAGLQVMPLPTDPQRFKLSQQDYGAYVQTVGNNPFNFYEPMTGVRLGLGQELHGLSGSLLAFSNHDQGSPFPQTGTDWMFQGQETFKNANLQYYRYTGRRALPYEDQFWRQGFGANYYTGRFSLNALVQTGNDTNALGTGQAIVSSAGYLQGVYQIGDNTFAYAREDAVNDTNGGFGRDFVFGTSLFFAKAFKLQVEDVLTTAGQTHNSLAIILGFGISTIHQGNASY